jgi:hypothetical protein
LLIADLIDCGLSIEIFDCRLITHSKGKDGSAPGALTGTVGYATNLDGIRPGTVGAPGAGKSRRDSTAA